MKLNPEVRTGLIWAGVHQAFALCGLTMLWVSDVLFVLFGLVFLLVDAPVFWLADTQGFENWKPAFFNSLDKYLPNGNAKLITFVLVAGAAQWFLIGYGLGLPKPREFWTRLRDEIRANLACRP